MIIHVQSHWSNSSTFRVSTSAKSKGDVAGGERQASNLGLPLWQIDITMENMEKPGIFTR